MMNLEHTHCFMNPQADNDILVLAMADIPTEHSLNDFTQVTEIESIVWFGRSRKKLLADGVIDINGAFHDLAPTVLHLRNDAFLQSGIQNGGEDDKQAGISHLSEGHEVEVAKEPHRHWIPTASRRSHTSNELDVNKSTKCTWRGSIIPTLVIHPLSENFNRRLGKVFLPLWHVHIINKDDILLQWWWSIHSFPPLLCLGVNQILIR